LKVLSTALLLLVLLLRPWAQPKLDPAEPDVSPVTASPGDSTAAPDSASADSVWRPEFVLRKGPLFTDIAQAGERTWVCGDSGLVAWSRDDSLWTRMATAASHLALNCLAVGPEGVFAAGDSGRVMLVSGDSLLSRSLPDPRDVCALLLDQGVLYACGGRGLFATSSNQGQDWTLGTLPEPARFRAQVRVDGVWLVGGTGGFLCRSMDNGATWQTIPRRDYTPIVDFLKVEGGLLLALGDGRVELMDDAGTFTPVTQASFGNVWMLHPLRDGWLLGGSGGNLLLYRGGAATELQLDNYSLFSAARTWRDEVLLCGNRGLLARLDLDADELHVVHNSLSDRVMQQVLPAAGDSLLAVEGAGGLPALELSSDSTIYLFTLLDGNPGISDNQNKLDRLARNYNQASFLGEPGFAVLQIDLDAGGRLVHADVLDEYPRNLGLGGYGLEILNSLEFKPGILDGVFVRTRLLVSLHFPLFTSNDNPWYSQDEFSPGALMDSLSRLSPAVVSDLPPREFVKALDFPRKARRYSWEGECLLYYELLPGQPPAQVRLLKEDPLELGFGEHSLEVLPSLGLRGDTLDALFPRLHVQHKLHYDRRQASKPAKAIERGHRFSESLYTVALVDSARFTPGLANLQTVMRDFLGDSLGTGTVELTVGLRPDGMVDTAEVRLVSGEIGQEFLDTLKDFILLFCWGYPANAERGAPVETVTVQLSFPLPDELPAAPVSRLFEGVKY